MPIDTDGRDNLTLSPFHIIAIILEGYDVVAHGREENVKGAQGFLDF
jgi:hypothetical protein